VLTSKRVNLESSAWSWGVPLLKTGTVDLRVGDSYSLRLGDVGLIGASVRGRSQGVKFGAGESDFSGGWFC